MNNWLDNKEALHEERAEKLYEAINNLNKKYPKYSSYFVPLLNNILNNKMNEDLPLELRNKLRGIMIAEEKSIMKMRDDIWNAIKEIHLIEGKSEDNFEIEECFFDTFEFKFGNDFYYFKLPKLHIKIDQNNKSENMQDKFIQTSISNSLLRFQSRNYPLKKFSEYTILFIHHYLKDNEDKYDTDNIEIKKSIDAINGILIENDTISRSHIFQITERSSAEFTEMYILNGHSLSTAIKSSLSRLK